MLRYKDNYRVEYEKDTRGRNCQETFIRCSRFKGMEIYRHSPTMLGVYIPSLKVGNKIMAEHPTLFRLQTETSCEMALLFDEATFAEAFTVLKARKRVKKELTEEQRSELRNRMATMRKSQVILPLG